MKTTHANALAAGAFLFAIGSSAALAGGPKPFEVEFDKCYAHDGDPPYLFTFSGPASFGKVTGTVDAKVLVYVVGIEKNWTHIQADYVVTAGPDSFTARVGGRRDDRTGDAVLNGFVSEGPLPIVGADVHDEFASYSRGSLPCAKGTLYITPRWKQTHGDDNDD